MAMLSSRRLKLSHRFRLGTTATVLLWAVTAAAIAPGQSSAASRTRPTASLSRVTAVTDRTYLRLVGSPGLEFTEDGTTYGTISGSASCELTLEGGTIAGTFVLHARGGVLKGTSKARIVGDSAAPVVRFVGSISVEGGTGSYAHASGQLSLKGSIRRSNYALYEESSGKLHL
jgi:hypothetical protein